MDLNVLSHSVMEANLKIDRANSHIKEAETRILAYLETDFCSFREELDVQSGKYRYGINTLPLPIDVSLAIGDAFGNLDASLDYLMTGAMRAKTGKPGTRVHFPVHETRDQLRKSFDSGVAKAFPRLKNFVVDKIQPYRGGRLRVWETRRTNTINKHRLIIPTASVTRVEGFRLYNAEKNALVSDSVIEVEGGWLSMPIGFAFKMEIESKGKPSARIAFSEGAEVFTGEPVIPTMRQCSQLVRETIEICDDHLRTP